jgi:hypothetical protein
MAGYSGTPLVTKLGIRAGSRVALVAAPPGFVQTLDPLPEEVDLNEDGKGSALDVLVCFTSKHAELEKRFAALAQRLSPAGGLWIAWPKKASRVPTDLTENRVREVGLAAGWVDNKVCAVDETWSGLRFVMRLKDRPGSERN